MNPGWIALVIIFASSLARAEQENVVVFENKNGQTFEKSFTQKNYSDHIEKIMSRVNESVLPILDAHENHGSWKLRAVLVGLGLNVGPAKSRFQLIYTRSGEPFTP